MSSVTQREPCGTFCYFHPLTNILNKPRFRSNADFAVQTSGWASSMAHSHTPTREESIVSVLFFRDKTLPFDEDTRFYTGTVRRQNWKMSKSLHWVNSTMAQDQNKKRNLYCLTTYDSVSLVQTHPWSSWQCTMCFSFWPHHLRKDRHSNRHSLVPMYPIFL